VGAEVDELEMRSEGRIGERSRADGIEALAYSRQARTPCLRSMLYVHSGLDPSDLSARNSARNGWSFGRRCS
jgi:hypothetical protein